MRLSFRLILSLIFAVTIVSVLFALYQVQADRRARRNDLEKRAQLMAESLQETVQPLVAKGANGNLQRLVERFGHRERMEGVAIYDPQGHPVFKTSTLSARLGSELPALNKTVFQGNGWGEFFNIGQSKMHLFAVPLHIGDSTTWALAVFHDASYIDAQNSKIWRDTFKNVLIQMLLISTITLLIVRWTMELPAGDVFKPLTREVTHLADSLKLARASAEEEARLRETANSLWTAERLRVYQQATLEESRLFVVSNREPYEHVFRGGSLETIVPASGLVTAMEPILRACDGTWIAHGAGEA